MSLAAAAACAVDTRAHHKAAAVCGWAYMVIPLVIPGYRRTMVCLVPVWQQRCWCVRGGQAGAASSRLQQWASSSTAVPVGNLFTRNVALLPLVLTNPLLFFLLISCDFVVVVSFRVWQLASCYCVWRAWSRRASSKQLQLFIFCYVTAATAAM